MTADVVSRLVDGVEVFALLDVRGPFFEPVRAAFTGATEADWDDAQRIDPDAFASDGTWTLAFRAFVVRGPGLRTTLIPDLRGGVWGKVVHGGQLHLGQQVCVLPHGFFATLVSAAACKVPV